MPRWGCVLHNVVLVACKTYLTVHGRIRWQTQESLRVCDRGIVPNQVSARINVTYQSL